MIDAVVIALVIVMIVFGVMIGFVLGWRYQKKRNTLLWLLIGDYKHALDEMTERLLEIEEDLMDSGFKDENKKGVIDDKREG